MGNAGGKLSGSLLHSSVAPGVHDLDVTRVAGVTARAAQACDGPAVMIQDCDAVITCQPNPVASAAVVDQMLPEVTQNKIWMEMSITNEAVVKRLGAEVIARAGAAVDCRVSENCHRARSRQNADVTGCERGTFDRIVPLLTVMGRRIRPSGQRQRAERGDQLPRDGHPG